MKVYKVKCLLCEELIDGGPEAYDKHHELTHEGVPRETVREHFHKQQ